MIDGTRGGALAPGGADPGAPADVGAGLAALSETCAKNEKNGDKNGDIDD
jgi:hypothetical protein